MEIAVIIVVLLLVGIGVAAIVEQIKEMFFETQKPLPKSGLPKVIRLSHLCGQNAEYRLRSALFNAKRSGSIIYASCDDEESLRICQLLSEEKPNCIICKHRKAANGK